MLGFEVTFDDKNRRVFISTLYFDGRKLSKRIRPEFPLAYNFMHTCIIYIEAPQTFLDLIFETESCQRVFSRFKVDLKSSIFVNFSKSLLCII